MVETRTIDLIGMCFGVFYVVAGVYPRDRSYYFHDRCATMISMRIISEQLFLVVFGLAAAFVCHAGRSGIGEWFLFLCTFTGKGIFFTVMGFYLDMQFCPGNQSACFNNGSLFLTIGVIVSIGSIILGVVILILVFAGSLRDRTSVHEYGWKPNLKVTEIAAAVGSVGMIGMGAMIANRDLLNNKRSTWEDWFEVGSIITILLVSGIASFFSAIRASPFSPFFRGFFKFLAMGWQRGLFYVLMGCWLLSECYPGCSPHGGHQWQWPMWGTHASPTWPMSTWVMVTCSCVSIIVGIVFIVQGCFKW